MIVLDTNVVSEAMKSEPHPNVRHWLNEQLVETLYLSSVTLAELLFGIAILPEGKRKDMLAQTLDDLEHRAFLLKRYSALILCFSATFIRKPFHTFRKLL